MGIRILAAGVVLLALSMLDAMLDVPVLPHLTGIVLMVGAILTIVGL